MKVYIRVNDKGIFASKNIAYAYYGFYEMGAEIEYYRYASAINDYNIEDIIVGYVADVRYILKKYGLDNTEKDYPLEIQEYLGRKIWESDIDTVSSNSSLWPVFIKLKECKLFNGIVIRSTKDLFGYGISPKALVYCSEVINFVAEWRVFVRYGKILSVRPYFGDWKIHYDSKVIEQCLNDYKSQPAGFAMDFGVTDDGRTLLIEVNDGFSIGCYGLDAISYAKLLSARWADLTNTLDEYDFINEKEAWIKRKNS